MIEPSYMWFTVLLRKILR